jgi:hypothetical protein
MSDTFAIASQWLTAGHLPAGAAATKAAEETVVNALVRVPALPARTNGKLRE